MFRSYVRRTGFLAPTLTVALVASSNANAYCVTEGNPIPFWSLTVPDLRIPVWVTLDGAYSLENIGQSPEDVARVVIEAIARHNELVASPKLYFAGFSTVELDFMLGKPTDTLPAGITILSPRCEEIVEGQERRLYVASRANTKTRVPSHTPAHQRVSTKRAKVRTPSFTPTGG